MSRREGERGSTGDIDGVAARDWGDWERDRDRGLVPLVGEEAEDEYDDVDVRPPAVGDEGGVVVGRMDAAWYAGAISALI